MLFETFKDHAVVIQQYLTFDSLPSGTPLCPRSVARIPTRHTLTHVTSVAIPNHTTTNIWSTHSSSSYGRNDGKGDLSVRLSYKQGLHSIGW
jgi:hypothetical protein